MKGSNDPGKIAVRSIFDKGRKKTQTPYVFGLLFAVSALDAHIFGVDDPRVGVRGEDLLAERLGPPADEEKAPGDAVNDLPERVDAAHAAVDRVPGDAPFDADPGVVPAEGFQRVENGRCRIPPDDGVAERGMEVGLRRGGDLGRGFETAQADAEAADLGGIFGAQAFELRAAQPQDPGCGGLLAGPGAVMGEIGGEGFLILDETSVFAPEVAECDDECGRDQHGVEDKVFFHGFRDFGDPER